MPKGAQRFRGLNVERQAAELARVRVLGGPDNGVVFVITAARVTIGRGEENDIILTDLKTSRKHIELTLNNGLVFAKDMGSSNGFLLNGIINKQASLKSGDKIGLGETVLEFVGTEAGATRIISNVPAQTARNVGTGSSGLTQFIQKPQAQDASAGFVGNLLSVFSKTNVAKSINGAGGRTNSQGFLERNRKVLFLVGGLMALATLLPEVEQRQKAKRNRYVEPKELEAERGISSLRPPVADEAARKSADIYFKEGFRELRAKNFTRAQTAFETALQIDADHSLARIYLDTTKKSMELEGKSVIDAAKKDEEASRYGQASRRYASVKRMYNKDQSNPLYKEADVRNAELEKKIKDEEVR